MSDNKKYYWLKLKDNFFQNEDLRMMEAMENGFIYSNLYLKMMLLSVKNDGRLMFKDRIPYDAKMIAGATNIPIETVRCGIQVLEQFGFIEKSSSGVIYIKSIKCLQNKEG